MNIPFFTKWRQSVHNKLAALRERLSRLTSYSDYRERRLHRLEGRVSKLADALSLLLADLKTNSRIGIISKGDLEEIKKGLPKHPDVPPPSVPQDGIQCAMTLVNKGDKKHKIKKSKSLARRIVDHLARMGDDWSLESEVKEKLLGDDAVKKGGGHFSRTMHRLEQLGILEFDKDSSTRLSLYGHTQQTLLWNDLREYSKLIDA